MNNDIMTPFRQKQAEIEANKAKRQKRQRIKDFINKSIATVIVTVIAFLPTAFFFFAKNMMNPEGFWQNFAVYGIGVYFLGGIQIGFFFAWLGILLTVIWD